MTPKETVATSGGQGRCQDRERKKKHEGMSGTSLGAQREVEV